MKTLNDYMAMSYRMEIVEDKDEGGFVVSYPDLPGCITCGETVESAVVKALDMKKKFNIMLCTLIGVLSACNEYDFDQEQYRNEVGLLSNSSLIYDRQVANVGQEKDTIYLVATVSGSQISPNTHHVALLESDSLLKAYNKSNFDIEKEKFAKLLPDECYDFPNKELDIQAGTSKVMFPIYLKNLERISPDSIYFLDYKIDPEKTPNYNPDKSHVLLRIYKENYYATTKTSTYYNYTSSTIVIPNPSGSPEVRRPTNANQVFPIGANSVRMMAGDEDLGDYKTARSRIVSKSIILEIGEQQPENPQARELTIRAHDRVNDVEVDPVDVVQLTPIDDYDNTFLLNAIRTPDGRATYYKEFRLHYKYRLESTAPYREVKAKLRYEFNPRVDNL